MAQIPIFEFAKRIFIISDLDLTLLSSSSLHHQDEHKLNDLIKIRSGFTYFSKFMAFDKNTGITDPWFQYAYPIFPAWVRGLKPNQTYVGDITYIHNLAGWLYLAVVIDLYSWQIVGWSMAKHMDRNWSVNVRYKLRLIFEAVRESLEFYK